MQLLWRSGGGGVHSKQHPPSLPQKQQQQRIGGTRTRCGEIDMVCTRWIVAASVRTEPASANKRDCRVSEVEVPITCTTSRPLHPPTNETAGSVRLRCPSLVQLPAPYIRQQTGLQGQWGWGAHHLYNFPPLTSANKRDCRSVRLRCPSLVQLPAPYIRQQTRLQGQWGWGAHHLYNLPSLASAQCPKMNVSFIRIVYFITLQFCCCCCCCLYFDKRYITDGFWRGCKTRTCRPMCSTACWPFVAPALASSPCETPWPYASLTHTFYGLLQS